MTDKCKSCNQEIIWIEDQDGTRLPVNKTRVRVYHDEGPPGEKAVWRYAAEDISGRPLLQHISHFLTCPNAAEHSKR